MKTLWCWRCGQEMPMLDDAEFAEAMRLYGECMKGAKELRREWNLPPESANIRDRFLPIRKWYEQLTGMPDCHENAILHHRLASFGEPCGICGKPLRSPRARFCAACGAAA